jgi:hypothetical protein
MNQQDIDNIPQQLRSYPNWVCYRFENHGKPKLDKVPYDPKKPGKKAKVNDPSTWGSFDQALEAAENPKCKYDGIGFVFSDDDPFTGIDLDHCVKDGVIEPWAKEIINQMDSYSELSPSLTGVHIYTEAIKTKGRCRKGDIEIYVSRRFLTVTGKRLPDTPMTIEKGQEAINKIHAKISESPSSSRPTGNTDHKHTVMSLSDAELISKAITAKDSSKFKALWNGDTSGYGDDDSRADMALCGMLAFWTGKDHDRMDALFRQSGLMREKWDRRTGEQTYGDLTISKAIESCIEVYKGKNEKPSKKDLPKQSATLQDKKPLSKREPVIRTAKELFSLELPEVKWIVDKLFPQGLGILAGKPKVGKSWLILHVALAVSLGGVALGSIGVEKGDVLYLALEDIERRLKDRLNKLLSGGLPPDNFHYCTSDWGKGLEAVTRIDKFLDEHKDTRLVVVDTLQKIRDPSQKGAGVYEQDYEAVSMLKCIADKHGVAVIVIHHQRKATSDDVFDTISGSLGITGSADTIAILKKEARTKADGILHVTGRDVEESELALNFDANTGLWQLMGGAEEYRLSKQRQEVIDFLKNSAKPMTPIAISKGLGKTRGSIRKLLIDMVKDSQVSMNTEGGYSLLTKSLIEGEI